MSSFCSICKKEIPGKPWISIRCAKDCIIHGCSYLCHNRMGELVGNNFYEKVINKEDFNYLFPVLQDKKQDVSTNTYERDNLLQEIYDEQLETEQLEQRYEREFQQSSESDDDWENSE